MTLHELTAIADIKYNGEDKQITNLSCNSKQIKQGGLFFAIKGTKNNGADYINDAVHNGENRRNCFHAAGPA